MSVDSSTGVGVVAGVTTGGVATLANTGMPVYVPIIVGSLVLVLVAAITRMSQKS